MSSITTKVDTILKSEPVDTSLVKPQAIHNVKKGDVINYKWIRKKGNHYLMELLTPIQGRFNWYIYVNHVVPFALEENVVTVAQVEHIMRRRITPVQFKNLNECLRKFNITTPATIRHFLAQIGHESGGLRWMVELASGEAYEGRRDLGNTQPGDGRRFKGVDALQLTGRANYQAFANFMKDPNIMQGWEYVSRNYSFLPSGFWWYKNNMNALVNNGATVRQVTRRVNGGFNGLADREQYYKRALEVI